jgi:hypothetical protein
MMDTYSYESWLRLGHVLERRRGELGYGFRQRARFVRERGGGRISVKTISRLEKGQRGSYPESTIGTIEAMYQWSPGSVEVVLKGGEPNMFLVAPPANRNPITSPYTPPTSGERLASWVYVRMRQCGHSDSSIHEFLDAEGFPREPSTVSAVRRIAEATGATVAEVLALLGVEDINTRRILRPVDVVEDTGSEKVEVAAVGTSLAEGGQASRSGLGGREAPLLATTGTLSRDVANQTAGLAHGESSW